MQRTSLICNNFSGINRTSSIYSSSLVTASDMQNVELFSTGVNSGVGIRTSKGNIAVCDTIPQDETVINIFESVQKGEKYFFVHTESESEGKIYLFNEDADILTEKVSGLSVTGKSSACDVSQGWSDLFVFSNGEEVLSIELGKYVNGELDEVIMMNLTDTDGRTVKGLGLVVYAGRLWIFSNQVLWYSVQEDIYDFSTSDAGIVILEQSRFFIKIPHVLLLKQREYFQKLWNSPGGVQVIMQWYFILPSFIFMTIRKRVYILFVRRLMEIKH